VNTALLSPTCFLLFPIITPQYISCICHVHCHFQFIANTVALAYSASLISFICMELNFVYSSVLIPWLPLYFSHRTRPFSLLLRFSDLILHHVVYPSINCFELLLSFYCFQYSFVSSWAAPFSRNFCDEIIYNLHFLIQ
jgi:hypothetical protein